LKVAKARSARAFCSTSLDTFKNHEYICANNAQTVYTYNQGVPVGGLAWLYTLTKDEK